MSRLGAGRFARTRGVMAVARVELMVHDRGASPDDTISFACDGQGWVGQGHLEEVPASGYDEWKEGATAGVRFGFSLARCPLRPVTVTKIEGMSTDTSPAAVGAAAALAVFDALSIPTPASFFGVVEEIVFTSRGVNAPFSL